MKIKIKEFAGKPIVRGFYPREGFRLLPGQEYEFTEEQTDQFWDCIETGLVEEVRERPTRPEPKKRGRPRKEDSEEAQPGA